MNIIGIYKIKNTINNKLYVGSSINIRKRKNRHFSELDLQTHGNKHLQNAYNKYGKENFDFEIIEICNKDSLLIREQYYIDTLNPEYNILPFAKNNLGYKHSKKTIEKLKTIHLGHKHTKETKEKIKKANLGKKMSDETIQKCKDTHKNPIVQLDKNGNFIREFNSASEAGRILKTSNSNISSCCRYEQGLIINNHKTAKKFRFMLKKDYDDKKNKN